MILFVGSKFAECKHESECKFLMGFGCRSWSHFFGTGAGVKKVTPITSGPYLASWLD